MIKEVSMNVMKNDFNLFINRMDLSSFPRDEYNKWDRKQKACFNLTFKGDEKPDCKIFIKNIRTDKETGKNRLLTPIEAERLQSFPDDWTNTGMPEKRRYFMMGNALVTKIIYKLEPNLNRIITDE